MSSTRCVVLCAVLASSATGQTEVPYSPLTDAGPPGSASLYGLHVAAGGDVDGDGVPDFVVGAPGYQMEVGLAYVHSGATGALLLGGPLSPSVPLGITNGHYQFGASLDLSRDFNGDGRADLIIGAPQDSGFTNRRGFVSLVDGATGGLIAQWIGEPQDLFGSSVAAGDINGDGHPDVVVGARQSDGFAGKVVVYSGVAPYDQLLVLASPSPVAFGMYGRSVAILNVNGDAYDDILVGADEAGNPLAVGPGFVHVRLGPDGTPTDYGMISGATMGDHFGFAVANAGDFHGDADEFDDFLVGAPQYQSGGSHGYARLYDGLTGDLIRTFQGEEPRDYFGAAVAGLIDFNGDGDLDLIIGAHQEQFIGKRGYVRIHSGSAGLVPPFLFRRAGGKASAAYGSGIGFGRSIAVLGKRDVFTTECFVASSASYAGVGHVEVLSGRDLLLTVLPDEVSQGQIFSLLLTQMPPGSPVILLGGLPPAPPEIHPVLGVALLLQSIVPAGMQGNQALLLSAAAPAGLTGVEVLLQCAGKPAGENIRITDIQSITF